jgi:hypothetical protein
VGVEVGFDSVGQKAAPVSQQVTFAIFGERSAQIGDLPIESFEVVCIVFLYSMLRGRESS